MLAVTVPIAAALSDRFGRKPFLVAGTALTAAFFVALSLAETRGTEAA